MSNLKMADYNDLVADFRQQITDMLEDNKENLARSGINFSYLRGDTSHRGYLDVKFSIDWEKRLDYPKPKLTLKRITEKFNNKKG